MVSWCQACLRLKRPRILSTIAVVEYSGLVATATTRPPLASTVSWPTICSRERDVHGAGAHAHLGPAGKPLVHAARTLERAHQHGFVRGHGERELRVGAQRPVEGGARDRGEDPRVLRSREDDAEAD